MKLSEITCQSVQEDLGVGSPLTEASRRHLAECSECGSFQSGLDELSRFIDGQPIDVPRPEFKARIKTGIDLATPGARRQWRPSKKMLFVACWAGTLAVLVVLINGVGRMGFTPVVSGVYKFVNPTIDGALWKQVMAHTVGGPKGDPKSRFTVVEFGDFACPQCALMHRQFDNLPQVAPVVLYFVNRPFPKLRGHENALAASEVSCAAAGQGKFWPMYDAFYLHYDALEPAYDEQYADSAGIDGARLRRDLKSGKYHEQAGESARFCDAIGMTMTPAIIVRDNVAGTYQVASGRDQIDKLFRQEGWAEAAASPNR